MDWNDVSVDGSQPKGDLLRVEVKLDHVIKMLNAIHELINKPTL